MEQELRSLSGSGSGGSYGSNGGSSVTDTAELMTRNPWQRLVYLAMTEDFTRKFFLWWGVRHYSVNTLRIQGRMNKPLWLSGQAFSLESDRARRYAQQVDAFFAGVDVFKSWLWPLTVLALWPSEESLFIAKPLSGFVGFGYLLGAPLLLGLFNLCWQLISVSNVTLNVAGVQAALSQPTHRSSRAQDILWLLNPDGHLLNKATDYLRWQRFDKSDEPNEPAMQATTDGASHIVTGMKKNIVAQHRVARLAGIRALAKIVAAVDSHDIRFLETLLNANGSNEQADAHRTLQQQSITALKDLPQDSDLSLAARFYAQYQLWKLGYAKASGYDALFSVWALFLGFAKYQYLRALVTPVWQRFQKSAVSVSPLTPATLPCERGFNFVYFTRLQKAICTLFGQFPEVYFNHINNPQLALNDVLQTPQLLTNLSWKLPFFANHSMSALDLSQQAWWRFPAELWQQLSASNWGDRVALNLSSPVASLYNVTAPHALAQFLFSRNWTSFDWHHAQLNATWQQAVLAQLPADQLTYLDLSQTGITDAQIGAVANLVARAHLLETFKLYGFNAPTAALAAAYQHLPLSTLQLGHVDWTDADLAVAMSTLPATLKGLNLSGVPLYGLNLAPVAEAVSRFSNMTLCLANSQLTDTVFNTFITAMGNSTILNLDLSQNPGLSVVTVNALIHSAAWRLLQQLDLSGTGMNDALGFALAPHLPHTMLATLNLAKTAIGGETVTVLGEYLSDSTLQHLDLSYTSFYSDAFAMLAKAIPSSHLRYLVLENNYLSDATGRLLLEGVAKSSQSAYGLNLAGNFFGAETATALFAALHENPYATFLTLDNNPWPSNFLATLPITPALTSLSCNACGASGEAVFSLMNNIQGTGLSELSLADNPLGATALVNVARHLVTDFSGSEALGQSTYPSATWLGLLSAKAATNLTRVSLNNTGGHVLSSKALEAVLPQTNILTPRALVHTPVFSTSANMGREWLWPVHQHVRQLMHTSTTQTPGLFGVNFCAFLLALLSVVAVATVMVYARGGCRFFRGKPTVTSTEVNAESNHSPAVKTQIDLTI